MGKKSKILAKEWVKRKDDKIETTLSLPYSWALGETWTRFFDELKNKKIFGTRCPECDRVLVPARKFCPRCFVDTDEWVEVEDEGVLQKFTVVYYEYENQPREPPYGVGVVKLDGADTGLAHFIMGVDFDPEEVRKQLKPKETRMKAVWSEEREGTIFDIDHFTPAE